MLSASWEVPQQADVISQTMHCLSITVETDEDRKLTSSLFVELLKACKVERPTTATNDFCGLFILNKRRSEALKHDKKLS